MTETKAFYEEDLEDFEDPDDLAATQEFLGVEESVTPPEFRSGSLLSLDIGSVHTRAALYDIVEGRARFLAAGRAFSTAGAPMFDASEGVRYALDRVERITGRLLSAEDGHPIVPSTAQGDGTDFLASTLSMGPPLKTVVVGLLEKVLSLIHI